MPSPPKADAAPELNAPQWPDCLLRLRCHPFDQVTRQRVLAIGQNPKLHLNCRPERSIMSLLHHLENKWGPIVGEQGMPMGITLVPYNPNGISLNAFHLDDGDNAETTKVGHILDPEKQATSLQLWYSFLPVGAILNQHTSAGAQPQQRQVPRHGTQFSRNSSGTTTDAPAQQQVDGQGTGETGGAGPGKSNTPSVHSNGSKGVNGDGQGGSGDGSQKQPLHGGMGGAKQGDGITNNPVTEGKGRMAPPPPQPTQNSHPHVGEQHMQATQGKVAPHPSIPINAVPSSPTDNSQPNPPLTTNPPNPIKPAVIGNTRRVHHSKDTKEWMAAAGFGTSIQQRASQAAAAQQRAKVAAAKNTTTTKNTTTATKPSNENISAGGSAGGGDGSAGVNDTINNDKDKRNPGGVHVVATAPHQPAAAAAHVIDTAAPIATQQPMTQPPMSTQQPMTQPVVTQPVVTQPVVTHVAPMTQQPKVTKAKGRAKGTTNKRKDAAAPQLTVEVRCVSRCCLMVVL